MIATADHIGQAEIVSALCQLNALNWAYASTRLYTMIDSATSKFCRPHMHI